MEPGKKIPPTELILHPDGSIYHLKLKPEQLAKTIILVGDPQRVEKVSKHFDRIVHKVSNREIHTHTGYLKNKLLTVMSTGMGTDNIDIVMNELDALANIDLQTRMVKAEHTQLNIVRLGTSGALQSNIPLNSFIVSDYGLGLDGLLNFYQENIPVVDHALTEEFITFTSWPEVYAKPYIVKSSPWIKGLEGDEFIHGITATAPGFYGPQGRLLRLPLRQADLFEKIKKFESQNRKIVNFEMETSALYGLGKLLGHNALTVCVAIANRENNDYNQNYKTAIDNLIKLLLNKITN
ncbi:MAG: nucleoside phosphorylase [Bacteroidales bacterium]